MHTTTLLRTRPVAGPLLSGLLLGGLLLSGLLLSGTARAQEASACPQLPADANLTWNHRPSGDSDLCLAQRADGSEAFGLYISPKPSFDPARPDRAEQGQVDGQALYWYRAELAAQPGVEARETVLTLPDGRSAHIWLQAPNADALAASLQLVQGLHFAPGHGDAQVAGQ
ncbi:MAG TPA: hypothetical protein VLM17_05775 [Xanthomonadaceae bacterium]|nr:hypothetical protein [Xanthomonadaceae bacterium]